MFENTVLKKAKQRLSEPSYCESEAVRNSFGGSGRIWGIPLPEREGGMGEFFETSHVEAAIVSNFSDFFIFRGFIAG